ncbi:MAG: sigma-70 family RNA polymerase sigma factor [Planctomycetes bacterium]|nr:sigma-70 family RNA polymerase sigma factor [Planctomycetota bacterium]
MAATRKAIDQGTASCPQRWVLLSGGDSDESLESAWRAGDEAAFSELFRRHYSGAVAYAERYLSDLAAAEDVVQQAFLNVLQRRAGQGRFKSLVYTVTRNLALNELRRRGRRYVARGGVEDLDPASGGSVPLTDLIAGEEQRCFAAALRELPESEREAFCLKETRGLTYQEAGDVMGLHPDAVRRRVKKAFGLIRQFLSREKQL